MKDDLSTFERVMGAILLGLGVAVIGLLLNGDIPPAEAADALADIADGLNALMES